MMSSPLIKATLGAFGLLMSADMVSGNPGLKLPASPGYRTASVCPSRCADAGTNPANWTAYHNLAQFDACPQPVFEAFSIYDDVDDADRHHGIYACSSYGPDFANLPDNETSLHTATADSINNATFQVGWWEQDGVVAAADMRSAAKQLRLYLASGFGAINTTEVLYARSGRAAVGLYMGSGLKTNGVSADALKILEDNLSSLNTSRSVAMQFCEPDYTSEHIFGFFATSNKTFAPVQEAIKSWSNATCLSFARSQNFTSEVKLITPLVTTSGFNFTAGSNSTTGSNSTSIKTPRLASRAILHARSECSTVQVHSGDSCGSLADKCGISGADFTKYNDKDGLCSKLTPGQHVCCSSGDLPDFRPKPNSDGSCKAYYVPKDDNCAKIAAANSLTNDDLEEFNKDTWAWNGCEHLQYNMNICLSKGDPPMPAPVANAVCGPQVPGSERPTNGDSLADLNPCALNACCDVFGQCGITAEFCIDTSTGNPGSAEPGTNGCISNCGTKIVRGSAPPEFRKIAYFEGFGLGRDCLFQDARQIDASKYTHLHFGFGTLTQDYEVEVGDILSSYEFNAFKRVYGPKKILSFGGWAFSTDPATYMIFREGVKPANRLKMARSIADFIKKNDLDGVDIDWEYPGAPDIPGIPPGGKDDGDNYLTFLVILKNLLGGKSVSIAAPASYWYLKQYPLKKIAKVLDYIVYMTYDLHGQWDAQNPYSQEGCAHGNCLRSQVNLTETMSSLVMITKAEVPSNKVVVGVTSYGRSFNMAESGCHGPECLYTGTREQSDATKGPCTNTAGYISNAEIKDIMKDASRVTKHYVDSKSNSNILVYDDKQWVAYMDDEIKAHRNQVYGALNMGGSTDWATDLDSYNDVPHPAKSWAEFKLAIKANNDPYQLGDRHGNWTDIHCSSRAAADFHDLSPSERWEQLDCVDAMKDALDVWRTTDRDGKGHLPFSASISGVINGPPDTDCGKLDGSSCDSSKQCTAFDNEGSGPAGWVIWNSFVVIHNMYETYHSALYDAATAQINPALADFANKFTPIPPEKDNTWLLILLDIITIGVSAMAAPFFNNFLAKLPYFIEREASAANIKDLTMLAIGQSTTIAKDLAGTEGSDWTEQSQDEFAAYLGQAIAGWGNTTKAALAQMFDGQDKNIAILNAIIADGKLTDGSGGQVLKKPEVGDVDLEDYAAKAFFGFAIPSAWTVAKHHTFVIDSGYACGEVDPLGDYLDTETMHATAGCHDGKLYYLAEPKGDSTECHCSYTKNHCDRICTDSHFSAPPGIEFLDGNQKTYGGVTVGDLIAGSVRTYLANGGQNGGNFVDVTKDSSFEDLSKQDITTPGYIRLPVCSPERAYRTWDTSNGQDDPLYPCSLPKGKNDCEDSSFEDQTSDASPPVEDCLQIIKNIQEDGDTDWTTGIGDGQREIAHAGECKFGVETKSGADGNVRYTVGGQDVIDIINEAVKQFGGGGKVGAKGVVDCKGNVHGTTIKWGIY